MSIYLCKITIQQVPAQAQFFTTEKTPRQIKFQTFQKCQKIKKKCFTEWCTTPDHALATAAWHNSTKVSIWKRARTCFCTLPAKPSSWWAWPCATFSAFRRMLFSRLENPIPEKLSLLTSKKFWDMWPTKCAKEYHTAIGFIQFSTHFSLD